MEEFLGDSSIENSGAFLLPVTVAETLTRGCWNLVQQFAQSEEVENAGLFEKFVNEFEEVHQREANA